MSESLSEVSIDSAVELLATYAGSAADLEPMLANAPTNDDMNMRLQYIAGMGVNSVAAPQIYGDILRYRKWPEGLLAGAGEPMEVLQERARAAAAHVLTAAAAMPALREWS